jgi:CheY-like chemotaxis protein
MIDVHDDGIGIASDAIANIFDPFVQGSTRVGGQGGLGLGLVIVKQLTGLHGGTVSVASDGDGQGTKFTVRLPLSARSLTTPVSTASLSTPRTEIPRRVLLVDDNADALDLLSMFVEGAGHEVAIARDGSEALEVFERFHPSVAVIDINMPVMDGYDLAARLRLRTDRDPLALVALTGHGQPGDRERSRAAGFGEHLVKPVDLAQLLRVIGQSPVPSSTSESATS